MKFSLTELCSFTVSEDLLNSVMFAIRETVLLFIISVQEQLETKKKGKPTILGAGETNKQKNTKLLPDLLDHLGFCFLL